MKDYSAIAEQFCKQYPDIKNYRVLEVGSDVRGGLLTAMVPHVREIIGLNIIGTNRQIAPNARFEHGDIRGTSYPDNSLDLIISYAVFEHVGSFDVAMREMQRLLKPGAELVSTFGPIWSCMWGHHVWVALPDFKQTYIDAPYMPPWCHLLMTPVELRDRMAPVLPAKALEKVVTFVFESNEQSRFFHASYLEAFRNSGLESLSLKSNRNLRLENAYLAGGPPIETYLPQLEARYGPGDYLSASFSIRMRK